MRNSPVVLVLLVAFGCGHRAAEEQEAPLQAAEVTCVPVASSEVEDLVEVSGVIAPQPRLDTVVSSPVAGRVALAGVEEGDQVAAGALLATIEDPALPADSISAKANVAAAVGNKEAADQELARQMRLVESGIGARRDLDEARAKAKAAQAELDAANARSSLATKQLARRELRAPHAGVVLHIWKRTGESVDGTTSTPVAEVADVKNLEVRAQVAPAALVKLREGMVATIHVAGIEAPIAGSIARVAPAVDTTTLLGTVRVRLDATTTVPVGSAATARIAIGHHTGIVIPAGALRRSSVGADELVICEKGVAKIGAVTVGTRTEKTVEIVEGLTAGQEIVVDHVLGIEDGQKLTPRSKAP